jgi:hypothetical protein
MDFNDFLEFRCGVRTGTRPNTSQLITMMMMMMMMMMVIIVGCLKGRNKSSDTTKGGEYLDQVRKAELIF